MQRYFIKQSINLNQHITIDGENAYHIIKVMRMKVSDNVVLCDNEQIYLGVIQIINKDTVIVFILNILPENNEMPVQVTIAQGVVQKNKFEEIINKLTQLGTYEYIPLQLNRSNIKLNKVDFTDKFERFSKIVKEAAEQSHRLKLMKLQPVTKLHQLVKNFTDYDVVLVAYEDADMAGSSFKRALLNRPQKILVIIGPEGGLTADEIELIKQHQGQVVSLGPRILRTETAPLYVMSAISIMLELE